MNYLVVDDDGFVWLSQKCQVRYLRIYENNIHSYEWGFVQ